VLEHAEPGETREQAEYVTPGVDGGESFSQPPEGHH